MSLTLSLKSVNWSCMELVFSSHTCRECLHNVYISLQYSCYVVSRCLCLFSNIRYKMFCKAAIKAHSSSQVYILQFTFY